MRTEYNMKIFLIKRLTLIDLVNEMLIIIIMRLSTADYMKSIRQAGY